MNEDGLEPNLKQRDNNDDNEGSSSAQVEASGIDAKKEDHNTQPP